MRRKVVLLIIGALVATVLGGMPTASAKPKAGTRPHGLRRRADRRADQAGRRPRAGPGEPGQPRPRRRQGHGRGRAVPRAGGEAARPAASSSPRRRSTAPRSPSGSASRTPAATPSSAPTASRAASGTSWSTLAEQYPELTKLVRIGQTRAGPGHPRAQGDQGRAAGSRDGSRPAVLYSSTQHAREWITPEMNRRLLRYYLEQYAHATPRSAGSSTAPSCGSCPVANPDGYDYTFTEGNRLWRKNLRDNDGDGAITGFDGVDLNRNFPYRWGYDNEGSSPSLGSETYRGTGAGVRAGDPGAGRADAPGRLRVPDQLPLGRRAAALRRRLAGRHPDPGRPALRDAGRRRRATRRCPATTRTSPPSSTPPTARPPSTRTTATARSRSPRRCPPARRRARSTRTTRSSRRTARASSTSRTPRRWCRPSSRRTSRSRWRWPSRRTDPDDPVSVVGRTAPDFRSTRSPSPTATRSRSPSPPGATCATWRCTTGSTAAGRTRVPVREWRGGERYGDEGDVYYAEYRGVVRGADPGDQVKVWFTGNRPGKGKRTSESFTYRLAEDTREHGAGARQRGLRGRQPGGRRRPATGPKYAQRYVDALDGRGLRRRGLGRLRAGRAAPPRRARPLRAPSSGTSATTG